MIEDYSVHKINKNDFHLLIPLMEDSLGMDVNIKYFEWKFLNNPAGVVEGYFAKHKSGEIAAYYGAIPQIYIIEKKEVIIYQSCDTMTHSKHRRKGLFQLLAKHCYDQLRMDKKLFIIGFGGGLSTPGFLKFGWKEVFKIKYFFYPKQFNFFKILNYKDVVEINDFKKIEHLTLKSNELATIHSLKSEPIFKWRTSNPLHHYKTIIVASSDDCYLTYYEMDDRIIIFDYYLQNKKSGKQLFNYLKSKLISGKKAIVGFVQEDSDFSKILVSYGFISNPFKKGSLSLKTPFIFYAENSDLVQYNDANKWNISSFDHDAL